MASQETGGCLPRPHCPLQFGLGLGGFWRVAGPKGEGGTLDSATSNLQLLSGLARARNKGGPRCENSGF